ncbi:MAG: hypothetical protein ABJC74_16300 [Gemmatimonadota bacterium]
MRALSLAIVPLLGGLSLAAQQRQTVGQAAQSNAAIRIENQAGAVRVTGWDRDSVSVTTTLGDATQKLRFTGTAGDLQLSIGGSSTAAADLEVRVPLHCHLWIRTSTGEIDADGLAGSVTALTVSGRLRIGGTLTSATAESLEGNIELAADAGAATVHGGSGTVVLRGSMASAVATSVGGPLLIGLTGPLSRGRFESLSGNVSYKGPLTAGGTLELQSHSGDLDLRMAPSLGATYDIETFGGTIEDKLSGQAPRTLKGNATFAIGDGRARVTVRNFKGTVTLLKQETLGARQ